MKRSIFFISDGTGITAETLGHSLITQFEHLDFEQITIPYIDTTAKAETTVTQINKAKQEDGLTPLVFATLVNSQIRDIIATSQGMFIDFFRIFIGPLETELNAKSSYTIGRSHSMHNFKDYQLRIEAINYALNTDDGINFDNYHKADLILMGVSRCGKTPTCLYLALQYGIRAANYPITEDDLEQVALPEPLQPYSKKTFGLTIDPSRLQAIRSERRPDSKYASLSQCQRELRSVENLCRATGIPFLNTTLLSIEEISTKILATLHIERRML